MEIETSTRARPMAAVRVSRVNQETRMSASMMACARASTKYDFPVPLGPLTERFSARPTHSRVRNADWVAGSIEEPCSGQDSKV